MNACMKKHYGATFMNGKSWARETTEKKHVTFNALAEKFHNASHILLGATKLFLSSSF